MNSTLLERLPRAGCTRAAFTPSAGFSRAVRRPYCTEPAQLPSRSVTKVSFRKRLPRSVARSARSRRLQYIPVSGDRSGSSARASASSSLRPRAEQELAHRAREDAAPPRRATRRECRRGAPNRVPLACTMSSVLAVVIWTVEPAGTSPGTRSAPVAGSSRTHDAQVRLGRARRSRTASGLPNVAGPAIVEVAARRIGAAGSAVDLVDVTVAPIASPCRSGRSCASPVPTANENANWPDRSSRWRRRSR